MKRAGWIGRNSKLPLCIIMLLLLTGCWGARELKELSLVLGIGIDKKEEEPDKVFMTAQIVKPGELKKNSSGSNDNGKQKAYWNLQSDGRTMFEAIREYTHETSNKLYNAHNEVIVFGRAAAEDGVEKYLDFFVRAQETRPTTEIVVSNTTASEVLDIQPELDKLPGVSISKLTMAQGLTSHSMSVTLQQFVNSLLSPTTAPVAPMVMVMDDGGKKTLAVKGMAVFKKDKMVGVLTNAQTRGLLWTIGKVKTGVIDIAYEDGFASIEIKSAKSKVDAEIKDGRVVVHIGVKEEGVITAQTCSTNLESVFYITLLEEMQAAAIEMEIVNALGKASELNADIFGFGELLHKKYKKEWPDIASKWDLIFPVIQAEIDVECKIRAAGNITRPIGAN